MAQNVVKQKNNTEKNQIIKGDETHSVNTGQDSLKNIVFSLAIIKEIKPTLLDIFTLTGNKTPLKISKNDITVKFTFYFSTSGINNFFQ